MIFGGRLGNYKYYNMDQVIEAALELAKTELKRKIAYGESESVPEA